MAVYSLGGNQLLSIYNGNGDIASIGYDIDGNVVHTTGPATLKVMSFNIQHFQGINSQATMMTDILSTYEPDIIGFQECDSTYSTIPVNIRYVFNNYNYDYYSLSTNAFFSKTAFENVSVQDYLSQDEDEVNQWGTREYAKCYFNVGGKTVCWINTHLAVLHAQPRYDQCAELFALAEQEEYCIITGDLNHYSTNTSSADWQSMYKQFVDAGYHLANCKDNDHFTWTYSPKTTASGLDDTSAFYAPNAPDNIITTSNISIDSITFDDIKLEYLTGNDIDHIAIVTTLSIS